MLPTRAASAFHAAVHDLKVQRLAAIAAKRYAPAAPNGDKFALNMAAIPKQGNMDKSRSFIAMSKQETTTWSATPR